ncbi:LysR family transcriptional regulator [Pseudonocardia kunmingensis]|uniref:LysR family transcriptional regulator n=1 Tax=Pseudonocardia kunmingensis TaxID=630975 RepID=A0A543DAU2_9PSEU|nr:LysR substrate-binding domain-containing protein [Pseudonocardia kunmingensis]TQM06451.1 LysR family transcriptional regulator [Pseudonocardia kunmingensis]
MEHREIEIFLTLADELHFGRAAVRLRVSTARVSQMITRIERRIGAPLFERTSRRVELTPIGRRLRDELRPAYQQVQDAVDRAITAARGVRATLRVGFIGAASGRFVLDVAEAFRAEHVDCEVSLRENQFGEGLGPLRAGEIDVVLATLPARGARQPDLTAGSVLVEEAQLLAVSARHPFARRPSVSFSDIARTKVLRTPPAISDYWDQTLLPPHRLDGRPVERGPCFATTQEMLALIGADMGTYPVSTQFTSYYVRPDVAYVPIHDAPPYQRRLLWLSAAETARIRAFDRAAAALADVPAGSAPH